MVSHVDIKSGAGRNASFVLGMLCFVYVLNFLDRQLLSILAKPIQEDLHISDGQLGRLGGLYFALFYCTISVPVAWLADRTNRVRVLGWACAIWSAATVACGLSQTYPQLVLARMLVGVGEAGGVPPSYSIIADTFPSGQRGTALGVFNLGPPIGQMLGVAFGGAIASAYSWRSAFVVLGSVGIATAVAVLAFVREPLRGGSDEDADPAPSVIEARFWPTVRMFFGNRVIVLASFACAATQVVTYGCMNFTTLFLMREKGMTLDEVAVYYALLIGLGMGGGIYASGRLADHYRRQSRQGAAIIGSISLTLAIPFFIGFVWAPGWPMALLFLVGPMFLNFCYMSPAVLLVQEEVQPHQRTLAGALQLLIANLIGIGLGPTFVGMISDWYRPEHPDNSLQLAFYSLIPFYLLAIGLFWLLGRALNRRAAKT